VLVRYVLQTPLRAVEGAEPRASHEQSVEPDTAEPSAVPGQVPGTTPQPTFGLGRFVDIRGPGQPGGEVDTGVLDESVELLRPPGFEGAELGPFGGGVAEPGAFRSNEGGATMRLTLPRPLPGTRLGPRASRPRLPAHCGSLTPVHNEPFPTSC